MDYVRTLKSIQRAEKELVGQRAVDLALLFEKEYSVPLSFVLTNTAFEAFIEHNKLQRRIAEILLRTARPEKRYEEVREALLNGTFPNEMVSELVESYQSLGVEHGDSLSNMVAAEDAPFVNVILSPNYIVPVENTEGIVVNVRGLEELLLAIKECWACLFTASMQRFREDAGIGNKNLNVGVLIQTMPTGEITGEAWSATGSKANELTVKTYFGALDIGKHVEKDEFRLTKEFLKPVYQSIAIQTVMLARDEEDRLGKVPIGSRGEEQKLNDRSVIELGRLAKKASGILDCQVKLSLNVKGESITTLLIDRLLLTKGAVKLQSYQEEEMIEEVPPAAEAIKEAASEPIADELHVEKKEDVFAVDDQTGEERHVQETVSEDDESAGEEVPDAEPEYETPEQETPEVDLNVEESEPEETVEEPAEEAPEKETLEEVPEEPAQEEPIPEDSDEEIIETVPETTEKELAEPEEETPEEPVEETQKEPEEESIFAHVTEEPESDHVKLEKDETIIEGDDETGEADVVMERHEEEVVEKEEKSAPEAPEAEDTPEEEPEQESPEEEVAEEPVEADVPETVAESPEEDSQEVTDDAEDTRDDADEETEQLSFDEAWKQVAEALRDRYEGRFRNRPPEKLTDLFFELSNEIIIPHEKLIGKAVKAVEEDDIGQELEERVLEIVDEFLEEIR